MPLIRIAGCRRDTRYGILLLNYIDRSLVLQIYKTSYRYKQKIFKYPETPYLVHRSYGHHCYVELLDAVCVWDIVVSRCHCMNPNLIPLAFEPCIDDEHRARRRPEVDESVNWPPTLILSSVLISLGQLFYKLSLHSMEGTSALIILLMCNESLVWP